jgi:hypothetical protein
MSATGQKRRFDRRPMTSGLPSATDLGEMRKRVRFVPLPELAWPVHAVLKAADRDVAGGA